MDDDRLITDTEKQKMLLRSMAQLAANRDIVYRSSIADMGKQLMLTHSIFDPELIETFIHLADEHPAVTHNTFNVQRDLIYQPEQVTYPDNQLQLDFAKQSS